MRWHLVLALSLAGCSSIPNIRFMDLDGEAPDGEVEDGSVTDGSSDAQDMGTADSPVDSGAGCPNVVPKNATTCCGPIPCGNQYCSMTACTACMNKCVVGSLCCPNQGGMNVQCVLDASCP